MDNDDTHARSQRALHNGQQLLGIAQTVLNDGGDVVAALTVALSFMIAFNGKDDEGNPTTRDRETTEKCIDEQARVLRKTVETLQKHARGECSCHNDINDCANKRPI